MLFCIKIFTRYGKYVIISKMWFFGIAIGEIGESIMTPEGFIFTFLAFIILICIIVVVVVASTITTAVAGVVDEEDEEE